MSTVYTNIMKTITQLRLSFQVILDCVMLTITRTFGFFPYHYNKTNLSFLIACHASSHLQCGDLLIKFLQQP